MGEPSPAAGPVAGDPAADEPADGEESAAAPDARPGPPRLVVWAAGSLHAALLVALLASALHLSGAAGDVLAGLGTLPGIAVYLYLWAVTTVATRRALRTAELGADGRVGRPGRAAVAAAVWGAATGLAFLLGPLVVAGGFVLVTSGPDVLVFLALVGLAGSVVAAVVGGLVGLAFAGLDLLLVRAAGSLVGDPRADRAG